MSKATTVEKYIASAPEEVQLKLREMRACIRSVSQDAIESLKWGMPAFSYKRFWSPMHFSRIISVFILLQMR